MVAPIASLKLIEVLSNGASRPITIEVASPRPDGRGFWVCRVRIDGFTNKPAKIFWADSMQALCLGLRLVRDGLSDMLKRGSRLIDPEDGTEFPLDAYFERIPVKRRKRAAKK